MADLPLTAIGKPYKLPLRADAARLAADDALSAVLGIGGVTAEISDGAPLVTVGVEPSADRDAIAAQLDQFTIAWRIEQHRG